MKSDFNQQDLKCCDLHFVKSELLSLTWSWKWTWKFWTFPQPLTPWTIAASLSSGWYGISGTALNWVRSYLSNRVQRVKLLFKLGEPFKTDYGVLQGSVLGPLLLTLYTTPLSSVISRHNICHHLYADDTHIYLILSKTDPERCHCRWYSKLKLNPDKTELIQIGTKAQRDKFKKYFPTKLLDQDVTPTDSARNLGVEFDKDFKFRKHIKSMSIMLLSYTWFPSLAQMFNSSSD